MSFTGLLRDGLTWPASPAPVAGSARLRANLQTQRRRIGLLIDSLIGGGAERVTLNLELARRDPSLLEYVIVHELAHLVERGHNARFYAVMDEHLPDWRHRRRVLNGTAAL